MDNPFRVFDQIRQTFLRYLDSPFRLRYEALLEERRSLLNRDRQLFREPLIEPVAPYQSSGLTIAGACDRLGVSQDVADFIASGLFAGDRELYEHQVQAWELSRRGRAVVVTSGTGSGKTEAYLIPIFASLVEESRRGWGTPQPPPANHLWWRHRHQSRVPQRGHQAPQRVSASACSASTPLKRPHRRSAWPYPKGLRRPGSPTVAGHSAKRESVLVRTLHERNSGSWPAGGAEQGQRAEKTPTKDGW